MNPLISVGVPVCGTPLPLLHACLESIATQDYPSLEILVIDDNGTRDEQKECSRAVKSFIKAHKDTPHAKDIRYICHGSNKGLVQARRTVFEEAHGFFTTLVDSDDMLASPNAVSTLYQAAVSADGVTPAPDGGFDAVQCGAVLYGKDSALIEQKRLMMEKVDVHKAQSVVSERKDISSLFLQNNFSSFVWAKLYKTETVLEAYETIPFMNCTYQEDLLFSYFFMRTAKSYRCIPQQFYIYNIDTGMSAATPITNLRRWRHICTASSVYTTILYDMQERPLPADSPVASWIHDNYFDCITRNAYMLLHRVDKELYGEAQNIFLESWGQESASKAIASVQEMDRQGKLFYKSKPSAAS